jgi:hypothetical protein
MTTATIISFLDQHQGVSATLLTLVLVVVTGYYAVQNRRMAIEMRRAREAGIRPKLALDFHRLGPTAMTIAIRSVGAGAAFDVDVRIVYRPVASDAQDVVQKWRQSFLATGESRDFMPPGELNRNLNSLPVSYRSIMLKGTLRDAHGERHMVDECINDLAHWRQALGEAHERFVDADEDRRLATAFEKQFSSHAKSMIVGLGSIADAIRDSLDTPDADDTESGRAWPN